MGSLLTFLLIGLALIWVAWLIFKKDMMNLKLGQLLSYFAGVIITFVIVLLITTRFLPWWTGKLVEDTRNSARLQQVGQEVQTLWEQAISSDMLVATAVPLPPATVVAGAPQPTPAPTQQFTIQSAAGERTHTVQSGETLYRLSKTYNVAIDKIKQRNNLTGDNIQVGQQLIIPAP